MSNKRKLSDDVIDTPYDSDDDEVLDIRGYVRCDECKQIFTQKECAYRSYCMVCQRKKARHPQKECTFMDPISKESLTILVDEKLVDIMKLLNNEGYRTNNSCQDNVRKLCWISFDSLKDVQKLIQELKDCGLHNFVKYLINGKRVEWHFAEYDYDGQLVFEETESSWLISKQENVNIDNVRSSLRFPKKDIPKVKRWFSMWKKKNTVE